MRLLIRIVLGLVGVAVLGLAILLVPPHVQTRGIEPALPAAEDFRALLTAPGGPVGLRYLVVAEQPVSRGLLGHTVFLAEWADGRTFMIDAGMDAQGAADFAELIGLLGDSGEARFHGDVAAQLGGNVARVHGVGFTHLHIDHTQGIGALCAERGPGAAVFQTHWQATEHNFNTTESDDLIEASCLERRVLEGEGLLQPEGLPGLALVPLGGHTPGSTLFALAVDGHLWLFSGDTTNSKADLLEDRGKGFVYSGLLVPEHTARTGELRRWLAALDAEPDMTVVVSHDLDDVRASRLEAYPAP